MATETYYFKGKVVWANVHEPKPGFDKKKLQYSIRVVLDEKSLVLFRKSGLTLKQAEERDGVSVQFRRDAVKIWKGEEVEMGKPIVLDADGNNAGETPIGRDSVVEVKVNVYDTKAGKGHTLEAVKVLELVDAPENEVYTTDDIVPF